MVVYTVCIYSRSFIVNLLINSRFPKDAKKRRLWVRALNREDFVPTDHSCVCSEHFMFGWHSDDPADENYTPTIFSYKEKPVNAESENRAARRNIQKINDFREAEYKHKEQEKRQLSFSTFIHSSYTKSRDEEPSSDRLNQVMLTLGSDIQEMQVYSVIQTHSYLKTWL